MNGARYVVLYRQQAHPLATSRGELFEHRFVLYEKLGPGSHPCHFCGKIVTWCKRAPGDGPTRDNLHVEHLDGDTVNNHPSNLVPTCQPCNVSAGYRSDRIAPDEPVVMKPGGPTRATERSCPNCGRAFLAAASDPQRFCSRACADAAKVLPDTCRRGHPRSPENIYFYKGNRRCRPCMLLASQRYRSKIFAPASTTWDSEHIGRIRMPSPGERT